jgi:hypothetical protein
VNSKLELNFDYNKAWMYGKVWLTLHPYFYPTDSLNLDAKAMTVRGSFSRQDHLYGFSRTSHRADIEHPRIKTGQ